MKRYEQSLPGLGWIRWCIFTAPASIRADASLSLIFAILVVASASVQRYLLLSRSEAMVPLPLRTARTPPHARRSAYQLSFPVTKMLSLPAGSSCLSRSLDTENMGIRADAAFRDDYFISFP